MLVRDADDVCAVVCCPRCGRFGLVRPEEGGTFSIEWAASAVLPDGIRWGDDGVTPAELTDPGFGCGYDAPDALEAAVAPIRRVLEALP